MQKLYDKFILFLESENKVEAVDLILKEFQKVTKIEDFVKIYEEVLTRSLNEMTCSLKDKKLCVWKEHVRTSIVRTILECAFPCMVALRKGLGEKKLNKKAVIICPDGEYHVIGARMAADFFTLVGFDATYVGASTPKEEFIYAINEINPDVLAISVTNFYNIVSAKRTIEAIRKTAEHCPLIVVGGNAFINNPKIEDIGADMLLNTYEEIKKLAKEIG